MHRLFFASAAVINAGDKENENYYIYFTPHDEFKHPSIFGVPALLFTVKFSKNKITKYQICM